MSKSRYRPRWPRSASQWFRKDEHHRHRQLFRDYLRKVFRVQDVDGLIAPPERFPKPYWD